MGGPETTRVHRKMLVHLSTPSAYKRFCTALLDKLFHPIVNPTKPPHFVSEFNLLCAKNLTQYMHAAMTESTKPIFNFYFSWRERLKKIGKGEGHLSGGNWRSKVLKKKVEGELVCRILKIAKNGSSTEVYAEQDTTVEPTAADPLTPQLQTLTPPLTLQLKTPKTTIEPTSTEEYSEASLSELKRADVPKVL